MSTPEPHPRPPSVLLSGGPPEQPTSRKHNFARAGADAAGDPGLPSVCQVGATLPRLVSVPEAARLLGIGRTTAYELLAAGQLEVVHIGRAARVPVDAIDEFVENLRSGI